MKKLSLSAIALALLLLFSGCAVNMVTLSESTVNFAAYAERLTEVAETAELELTEVKTENKSNYVCHEYEIEIDDAQKIQIEFSNKPKGASESAEYFSIIYYSESNDYSDLDTVLMASLINSVSGKEVTASYLNDFLAAPEEEYAAERFGMTKTEEHEIYKFDMLNFWEDWGISYELYTEVQWDDSRQNLHFWGLTEASKTE